MNLPACFSLYLSSLIWALPMFLTSGAALGQPPSSTTDAPIRRMNLEALSVAAIAHSPLIRARHQGTVAAEAHDGQARVSPFMQFQATAGFTVVPDASGTSTYSNDSELSLGNNWGPAARIGIQGAIPLYTFGKIRALRRASRAGVRAAQLARDREQSRVEQQVRQAYFALQLALDLRQMVSEGASQLDTAIDTLDARLAENDPSVNPIDRYRLQAASVEIRARDSQAERLEESSRAALETLTGLSSIHIPECPIRRVDYTHEPLQRYLDLAPQRPENGMLEALVQARQANLDRHRAAFGPDVALGLEASYSYAPGITDQDNPFIQDSGNRSQLGAALVARWSLDFWGNHYRVRRAEAQLSEAQLQAEAARAGVALEVRLAFEALQDADRREVAFRQGRRETRRWFLSAAQGYQIGTTEARTLIDGVKAYFTNRFGHLSAIEDYNIALANLETATGAVLLPDDQWESSCEE